MLVSLLTRECIKALSCVSNVLVHCTWLSELVLEAAQFLLHWSRTCSNLSQTLISSESHCCASLVRRASLACNFLSHGVHELTPHFASKPKSTWQHHSVYICRVKVRLQTQVLGKASSYSGPVDAAWRMARTEGLQGFFRGESG